MTGRRLANVAVVNEAHEVRAVLDASMVVLCVLDAGGQLHLTTSYDGAQRELALELVAVVGDACRGAGMTRTGGTAEHEHKGKERGDA